MNPSQHNCDIFLNEVRTTPYEIIRARFVQLTILIIVTYMHQNNHCKGKSLVSVGIILNSPLSSWCVLVVGEGGEQFVSLNTVFSQMRK